MVIRETPDFLKDIVKLPREIKGVYLRQRQIFLENWLDTRLHLKRLKELSGVYSFRITRRYRVLFYFHGEVAIFFKVGHRKNIYE